MWKDIMFNSMNINSEIKIVKLGSGDKIINELYQKDLKQLVEMLDDDYPGIDIWYKRKVVPGLKDKERFAYLVYAKEKPVGLTIAKNVENSKLCSMRVLPEYQKKGMGYLLMSLVGRELRNFAGTVHFTAPQRIYNKNITFFDKLGFKCLGETDKQYRLFDKEILCTVGAKYLWNNILSNLDDTIQQFTLIGNPKHPDLVMSIKPEFANMIKERKKKIEIRRKFSKKWKNAYVMLYSTAPVQEFFGEAKISDIIEDEPNEIWKLFSSELGVDEKEYFEYCKGASKVNALVLSDINIYKYGILKQQLDFLLNEELKIPQSYSIIKEGTTWPTAISLSYLLLA